MTKKKIDELSMSYTFFLMIFNIKYHVWVVSISFIVFISRISICNKNLAVIQYSFYNNWAVIVDKKQIHMKMKKDKGHWNNYMLLLLHCRIIKMYLLFRRHSATPWATNITLYNSQVYTSNTNSWYKCNKMNCSYQNDAFYNKNYWK